MTYSILTLFDTILVMTLLWLGWHLLDTEDIFKAVVLFISFGLLMSLAWVRMRAPDVALAEAALGAGLTGPLFLAALRRMDRTHKGERRLDSDEKRKEDHESDPEQTQAA
jgi:energy-converting hydrogenase B subunit D